MSEDWKSKTKEAFDSITEKYVARDLAIVPETMDVRQALDAFASLVTPGGKVLDLGSGGGRDSRYLSQRGYEVTGIDLSEKMVEAAKRIDPKIAYKVMDLEDMDFSREEFDGIWANASLHHIPKEHLPAVLAQIKNILKSNGIFFIKVKQGGGEGIRENEKFGQKLQRYFSFYKPEELGSFLREAGFKILEIRTTTQDEWVDALAQK